MRRAALLGIALVWTAPALAQRDEDIRRLIVEDSLARFQGYCPVEDYRRRMGIPRR